MSDVEDEMRAGWRTVLSDAAAMPAAVSGTPRPETLIATPAECPAPAGERFWSEGRLAVGSGGFWYLHFHEAGQPRRMSTNTRNYSAAKHQLREFERARSLFS